MASLEIVPKECAELGQCGKAEFIQLIINLIAYAQFLALIVVGIAVIYGGFLVLTSAGDEGKVSQGRQAITRAVVGFAIVFGAWVIVNTIITLFVPSCQDHWNLFQGKLGCQ